MPKRKRDKVTHERAMKEAKKMWDHLSNNPSGHSQRDLERVVEIQSRAFEQPDLEAMVQAAANELFNGGKVKRGRRKLKHRC